MIHSGLYRQLLTLGIRFLKDLGLRNFRLCEKIRLEHVSYKCLEVFSFKVKKSALHEGNMSVTVSSIKNLFCLILL